MNKKLVIGFFGFGAVGQALFDMIQGKNLNIHVKKIIVKDPAKNRTLTDRFFSTDPADVLNEPSITHVIEMTNDPDEAFQIVQRAMIRRKHVITSNTRMVAKYMTNLIQLQNDTGLTILYDATVCGYIPIIRNLENYYHHEMVHDVRGIINSPSNYILTKIVRDDVPYPLAEKKAKDLGIVEMDSTWDIRGYDASSKLAITSIHAFGSVINEDQILNVGFQGIKPLDILWAKGNDYMIRSIARISRSSDNKMIALVMPHFVKQSNSFHWVDDENNGISVQGDGQEHLFFLGKGSGVNAIAAALLSDIMAGRDGYRYEYRKYKMKKEVAVTDNEKLLRIYIRFPSNFQLEGMQFEKIVLNIRDNDTWLREGYVRFDQLLYFKSFLSHEDVFMGVFEEEMSQIIVPAGSDEMVNGRTMTISEKSIL